MTTIQSRPKISVRTRNLEATTPENSPETATAVAVGPGEESNPGINVQQIPAGPPRLQLKLTNPDGPVRYIPIHIWPEHLKTAQPRTGRRYCPKRSRTLQKRNVPSPLVREYRYTEDGLCEDEALSDMETTLSESAVRSTLTTERRRGWGRALLGAVQNAVPKRRKEESQSRFTIPRKQFSLSQARLGNGPPGLRKRGTRESTRR